MLLFAVAAQGQNQTYVANTANFPNPDRGFYHYSSSGTSTTYSALSASTLSAYRTQNISMVHRTFYLNQFVTTPISDAYLANMQADFNAIRNAGLKIIIRFAYSKSESAAVLDATKTQILAHIQQVAPIILANKDVISIYQYGWIGCWGETYYSSQVTEFGTSDYENLNATQWANRKAVLDAMLNATPLEIPIQVRYVYHKQKMYPSGNDRIGFYNDAFLNAWGDSGTFLVNSETSQPTTTDSNYLQTQTINLPMAGETDGVNSPRTDCSNAMLEMNKYNWSLLNQDYLTANINNWTSSGCFSEMEKRLGYRFELLNSNITTNTLTVNIQNTGYANVFKPRKAYLILKNTTTNAEYSFLVNNDIRSWKEGTAIQITQSLDVDVPAGNYNLYLNLPDPNNTNPLYAIQMGNVGTWNATTGYNSLNQSFTATGTGTGTTPQLGTTTPITPTVVPTVQIIYVTGSSTVVINNLPSTTYTIKIYNLNGKLKSTTTDISNLNKGFYIVKVTCNGITYTQKIYKP